MKNFEGSGVSFMLRLEPLTLALAKNFYGNPHAVRIKSEIGAAICSYSTHTLYEKRGDGKIIQM